MLLQPFWPWGRKCVCGGGGRRLSFAGPWEQDSRACIQYCLWEDLASLTYFVSAIGYQISPKRLWQEVGSNKWKSRVSSTSFGFTCILVETGSSCKHFGTGKMGLWCRLLWFSEEVHRLGVRPRHGVHPCRDFSFSTLSAVCAAHFWSGLFY